MPNIPRVRWEVAKQEEGGEVKVDGDESPLSLNPALVILVGAELSI